MNTVLVDTVCGIVDTYGVEIVCDRKFWNILCDSYSFASDYALKNEFMRCISSGKVDALVAMKGDRTQSIEYIRQAVKQDGRTDCKELIASLFSIAIAVGSCSRSDYQSFTPQSPKSRKKTPPQSAPAPKGNPPSLFKCGCRTTVALFFGLITLFGGSLLYLWFLFGGPGMFFIIILIAILQLPVCSYCLRTLEGRWSDKAKMRAYACYMPLITAFLLNALVPFLLMSDSIADGIFSYFSADFIPSSYYIAPVQYDFLYKRITPEVGFWGGVASLVFSFFIFSCLWGAFSGQFKSSPRFHLKPLLSIIVTCLILSGYVAIYQWPKHELQSKEREYEALIEKNKEINNRRKDEVKNLSVKGVTLGLPMEDVKAILSNMNDAKYLEENRYNFRLSNRAYLLDSFLGLEYNVVFPQAPDNSGFKGIILTGNQYEISTSLDNQEVSMEIDADSTQVGAIVIKPFLTSEKFKDFQSLLNLYKTKYGEPEVLRDFSRETKSIFSFEKKRKTDRYIWQFKNGTIQLTEYGILYISSDYINKISNTFAEERNAHIQAETMRAEQIRINKQRNDSIKRQKEIEDSLSLIRNHQNALNEI